MEVEPYVAIFDIETQDLIQNMPGLSREEKLLHLQVSVACVLVIPSRFVDNPDLAMENAVAHTFWRDDNSDPRGPFEEMFAIFDNAELICGYNLVGFDFLVMQKYFGPTNAQRYFSHAAKVHDALYDRRVHQMHWVGTFTARFDNSAS